MSKFTQTHKEEIVRILAGYPADQKRAAVMPLLHLAQQDAGYISGEVLQEIAAICDVTSTEVASIVGFYTMFHDEPAGKIRLMVCTDVACQLRGAREYLTALCSELGIAPGQTTADGLVTIEEVKCIAACDHAPVFQSQMGDEVEYHENQNSTRTLDWIRLMTSSLKSSQEARHE